MFLWINENRLYQLARSGRRLLPWFFALPLGAAIAFFSQLGAVPLFIGMMAIYGFSESGEVSLAGESALVSGGWMALQLVSAFVGIFLLLALWMKFYEKRPLASLGYEKNAALWQYLRGLGLGIALFAGAVGILALFGAVAPEQGGDPARQGIAALGGVLIVFLGWMVQGAAEEALARGWMLPTLSARYKPWVGILLSSLFFAVLHGLNPNLSVIALVNLFLFGVFAAFYALREGSLWGISALHAVWNWVQGNFFGLQVSGMETGGGMLLNLQETGADWLTGGAFGPEGGLAVTLMLLLGISITLLWRKLDQTG